VRGALFNPSGGLRYHVRGYRYAETLWAPFRLALAEWVYAWEPPEKKLVLVGPSAGWCIQPFLFERFDEVLCLEPDPLAGWLFRRRLARAPLDHRPRVRFVREDHLLDAPERLPELLSREGDAAVMFSNVLGQLRVLLGASDANDTRLARVREAVHEATRARSWASFHDRVSAAVEPALEGRLDSPERLTDQEIIDAFYLEERDAGPQGAPELLDHLTAGFFPENRPHSYFVWPLLPGVFHLIEATAARRS
jgi:hypothetical protein